MSKTRKSPPPQPERDAFHFPDVQQKRSMLLEVLGNIRNQGYQASMNLMISVVQLGDFVTVPLGDGRSKRTPKEEHLRDLRETVENSKRAAERIQQEIDSLPDDPVDDDSDDSTGPQPVKD